MVAPAARGRGEPCASSPRPPGAPPETQGPRPKLQPRPQLLGGERAPRRRHCRGLSGGHVDVPVPNSEPARDAAPRGTAPAGLGGTHPSGPRREWRWPGGRGASACLPRLHSRPDKGAFVGWACACLSRGRGKRGPCSPATQFSDWEPGLGRSLRVVSSPLCRTELGRWCPRRVEAAVRALSHGAGRVETVWGAGPGPGCPSHAAGFLSRPPLPCRPGLARGGGVQPPLTHSRPGLPYCFTSITNPSGKRPSS